jgi:sucrose-6F-phosphate phosphohydrolase
MIFIVTDLDGTLIPNGNSEDDGSLGSFFKRVNQANAKLIYATGRNLEQMRAVVEEFSLRLPDCFIGEVGTRIYNKEDECLVEDKSWTDYLKQSNANWSRETIERIFLSEKIRLQEDFNQNDFKVSFYFHLTEKPDEFISAGEEILRAEGIEAAIIWSIDPKAETGLIDVLPEKATKGEAVEFLRIKYGLQKKEVFYSGDSGNDMTALTKGYNAIVVKNAHDVVKKEVETINKKMGYENYYIAKGNGTLNGNYSSGIIEGLEHFGAFHKKIDR